MKCEARTCICREVSIIVSLQRTNDVYTPLAHYTLIQVSLVWKSVCYYKIFTVGLRLVGYGDDSVVLKTRCRVRSMEL